jgi:hypothetical protein
VDKLLTSIVEGVAIVVVVVEAEPKLDEGLGIVPP